MWNLQIIASLALLGAAFTATAPACGDDGGGGSDVAQQVVVPPADTGAPDSSASPDALDADALDLDALDVDGVADSGGPMADALDSGDADATDSSPQDSAGAQDTTPPCALGKICNPIPIAAFPFTDARDTTEAPGDAVDAYACAPATDESGGEFFYVFTVTERGAFTASLDDEAGDGVDIDIHLLSALDGAACLVRGNAGLMWVLRPGTYYLVADTWVGGDGDIKDGPYILSADFLPLAAADGGDDCAMSEVDQRMNWSTCAPGVDCYEADHQGTLSRFLRTPAAGPVVHEAHLVTTADSFGGNAWPTAKREGIDAHYAASQTVSGYVMDRQTEWAPSGEGGSQWGQGATGAPLPPDAEAWYVNMHWRGRPAKGTRMLVLNPHTGKAVVAAGGYETGPGSNTSIGGAVEEIHHYLGTEHRDDLVMGYLVDQTLPFGPIICSP